MDKYLSAHFDLYRSQERSFNRIESRGTRVRKTIYDVQKGSQEIFFYKNIPVQLKKYYPKLKTHRLFSEKVIYEIELIKSFDLSVWYLRNELSDEKMKTLLQSIENYFSAAPKKTVSKKVWVQSTKNLVVKKLDKRWTEYSQFTGFHKIKKQFKKQCEIDIQKLKRKIDAALMLKIKQLGQKELSFSHGDLCFSNILLSSPKSFKLIDPKGANKKEELFFTLYYDLAKLSHSIHGNYDGILSGRKPTFSSQRKTFDNWVKHLGYDLKFVRLIESSLFLSLLPLHLNRPEIHIKFLKAALRAYRDSL